MSANDVQSALLELLEKQIDATQAQADAGSRIAAELSGLRAQLGILSRVETALTDSTAATTATQARLVELADRRAADVKAAEDKHRREGYESGYAAAMAAQAESVRGASARAFVTWIGSPAGAAVVGFVLLVLTAALLSPILPFVNIAAFRALIGGAP